MIWITRHAAERFQERVRPALDYKAANKELGRLLEGARLTVAPAWALAAMPIRRDCVCAEISDGVIVVCELDGGCCKAITVVVRPGRPRERPKGKSKRPKLRRGRDNRSRGKQLLSRGLTEGADDVA